MNPNDISSHSVASSFIPPHDDHYSHSAPTKVPERTIHVVGCNVWSDYSSDVIFDDGTALCFGAGLDAFVRVGRMNSGGFGGSGFSSNFTVDLQFHYTSHALSKDLAHVGAALKVISTISPRCKFLRTAVNASAAASGGGDSSSSESPIMHWKSQTVTLEEFTAPTKDDKSNIFINPDDNSVTVVAVGGNGSLWLSPNGAFFDVTWPCRAYESDGRSIQFVASEHNQPKINDRGINTVKSVLCVPHQQRFPVGLAIEAFRKHGNAVPEYRNESVENVDFFAPLACWAPLLRVALRVWKEELGGECPESVLEFLEKNPILGDEKSEMENALLKQKNPKLAAVLDRHILCEDTVSSNFPAPIPPKVCSVVSPFPKLSVEDGATLLASTSDRLHSLPIHERLHPGAALCVSWSSGEHCSWGCASTSGQHTVRSLIFEDMSYLHVEEQSYTSSLLALLHIQNAIRVSSPSDGQSTSEQPDESSSPHQLNSTGTQYPAENERTSIVAAAAASATQQQSVATDQQETETSSIQPKLKITVAAKVYSWATGSLEATSQYAHTLPAIVVTPANHISCSASTPFFALFAARQGSSEVDPRRGRYLHGEVEFASSFLTVCKQTRTRAAIRNGNFSGDMSMMINNQSSAAALGNVSLNQQQQMNSSSANIRKQQNADTSHLNHSTTYEGIGAVKCSSTIPNVGIFTAYQDGTVRCCFDDRTILTLKTEGVESSNQRLLGGAANNNNNSNGNFIFSIEEIFVTALDARAVSTRFRAAACTPQHPMYNYLQFALPFMRYASLPPGDREQLVQDPVTMTTCASDFDGRGDPFANNYDEPMNPVDLSTQLERVIAKSQLTLMRHNASSAKRQEMLDEY